MFCNKPTAIDNLLTKKNVSTKSAITADPGNIDERRFEFGKNWADFVPSIDDSRVSAATESIKAMLGADDLRGKRVLDIGSGSGLFSLAARKLGASVHSFDFDPVSVECTAGLRAKYSPADENWVVERGSVLDEAYTNSLGQFDLVYVWGVLHHTGAMWPAVRNTIGLVKPGGLILVALYNDQGWVSRYWSLVKRVYNGSALGRVAVTAVHWPYLVGLRSIVRRLSGRPQSDRGMSLWHDMRDWLGGWPFEVAAPGEVRRFFESSGFELRRSSLCGKRHGCNEFVFVSRRAGA